MNYYAKIVAEKLNEKDTLTQDEYRYLNAHARKVKNEIWSEKSFGIWKLIKINKITEKGNKYLLDYDYVPDNNRNWEIFEKAPKTSLVSITNSKEEKENASVQDKFSYKGCLITILKKSEGKYTFSITQKGREEGSNNVYSTQEEAERKAKREVETTWNAKEEKTNENAPFTKKRECLATLDRMLYYVQRKKSQVQQWKYIDEDFDENEFLSDLKDVLRAIEGIMG